MKRAVIFFVILSIAFCAVQAQNPEPVGWYSGDMHVHRSCGGSPESVSTMFNRMTPKNLAVVSQLADSGNGEVQNPTTDLPLVNGLDDPISTASRILHWDTEWHWDATYTQYPHQALGGHIVNLGLSSAQQLWQEYTFPILDWAHQHNGIAGFAHLQYLDGNGLPNYLTCCTPIEYPVEVALGAADFISEDVDDVNWPDGSMYSETPIQAYYKLLNSGFRPGFAAGTDYPCNSGDNGGALGGLLTYVQVAGGQLNYRNWVQGIANGRTVVSRNGHNEFLNLTVNGNYTPGDEIPLASAGNVTVTVQWTAEQNWSGTIELVQNSNVVASKAASVGPGAPATLTATVNFTKSGWLAARRMGTNPLTGNYEHYVHTAAVFVIVNSAPIRTSQADAQYFVNWTSGLLQNTSSGGIWNSYFPTSLAPAQARYQAAKALYQQVAAEATGSAPSLNSIALTPSNQTIGVGSQASFTAMGSYSSGPALNITGQVRWTSSNPAVAAISARGLVSAINPGSAVISASLNGVTSSTNLTVAASLLVISTQSLSMGTVGVPYSAAVTATGGTLPYTWSIASGSLPTGLTLNASTGVISGTPGVAGTSNVTVQVSDSGGPMQEVSQALTITIRVPSACPCSIWPSTAAPLLADGGPDSAVEVGVEFRSDLDGYIAGIRFYKSAANTGTHVGNLWSSGGTLLATAAFTGESSSGWQQVNFSAPVPVTAGAVYVASYHSSSGHYADDQNFFASHGVDNSPLHALQDTSSTPNGVYAYGGSSFPSQTWYSSNYWVDVVFLPSGPDTTPPTVRSVSPVAGASGVDPLSSITASFSEALTATTVNGTSMQLLDPSSSPVAATVTYNSGSYTVTLTPNAGLLNSTTYTVVIKGGTIKDVAGNALASDYTWSFTTAAPPPPPPTEGPGGPILVVSSSVNPFSRYSAEILRNEGFNEFTAMDVSLVAASTLNNYEVVILGNFTLTPTQVSMFTTWVNNGGNLIAMRPDKQLASVLGLTDAGAVLTDGYLLINTTSGPGSGLVNQTVQFHGNADRYTMNGATSLATLYSSATASTANPAVTLNQVGLGQAAAFTYDLARSVVYTRQGNPAWSGQARDGQSGPIRSDDLYYGAASFDPEPDYVDPTKIAIPQADEQQRLLANLIIQMNLVKQPLPRFWYFPRDLKAAVVMTGDDHGGLYGGGATSARFDEYLSLSPTGCSVTNWECVRASAYLLAPSVASNPLTNAQAASYISQGFEVGVHVDSVPDCSNWTLSDLATFYSSQISSFLSTYTTVPRQKTHRMHCIGWSDYDSQPQTELQNGVRLDTNYYYWPPSWVNDTPGMFTGSGMPMRFTKRDGTMLDIYQATTQMTDESSQSYPLHIDTLLDNAIGASGYYGYFTANMHNDAAYSSGADAIIASAQSRGVPIISAAQLLTWLDGRNGSSFSGLAWNGSALTFTIAVGSGGNGLQAMLPANAGTGTLSSINLNGSTVTFSLKTIKGISYAVFPASAGTYVANYAPTGSTYSLSGTISGQGGQQATVSLTGASTANTTSDASGNYSFSGLANGSYTATPSKTGYVFTPTNQAVTINNANAAANFTAVLQTYGITGNISGTGAAGTTVSLTGTSTATTTADASGNYSLTGLANGSYTVTPSKTGYVFTPTNQAVTINNANATVNFTAAVPVSLSTVTLSPTSVVGGTSSTGTVTLSGAAPTGGTVVALSSSNTSTAQVPATVTVAAGSTSATFTITTTPVASQTAVVVTASAGGVNKTATLTVNPPALSTLTRSPTAVTGGTNSTGTVTLTGRAPTGGFAVTLTSANPAVASVPTGVTVAAGSTSATFTITTTPVSAQTAAVITASAVTVNKTTTLTVNPPALSSLSLRPTSVIGGNTSTGTVTLSGAAPAGGIVVALTSSNRAAATVPANVSVPAATTTATFTIATYALASSTTSTISATLGTVTKTASLTVTAATLSSITLNPSTVKGGTSSTGTVTLTGPAPSAGAVISLSSSNGYATVPSSITVPAGSTTATITVNTVVVTTTRTSTISARYSVTKSATLTITP